MRSFVALVAAALFATAFGSGCSRDATEELGTDKRPSQETRLNLSRQRLPNVELQTHEGKIVRFYDDLIKGNIVAINFMYATCKER